jgi:hypothetical protein
MSGGGVKAHPRCSETSPRELKSGRGSSCDRSKPPVVMQRIAAWSNALEARPAALAPETSVAGRRSRPNDKRARPIDEVGTAKQRGKPLRHESWTWQWDETSPRRTPRSKPSRARETLRAERQVELGSSAVSGLGVLMSRRGARPSRRYSGRLRTDRVGDEQLRTLKRRCSPRGDEPDP